MHSTELDDPGDDEPPKTALAPGCLDVEDDSDQLFLVDRRQAEIASEFEAWSRLNATDRRLALRQVIARSRPASAEALVRLCSFAHAEGDRPMLSLAFEALSKVVTPLLLSQAWGMSAEERRDQVQQILLQLLVTIQSSKAGLAASCFAAFAKRRAISLYRAHRARFEGANEREEPAGEDDPLDNVPGRIPSAEHRALLALALGKLLPKHRAAFIQYHRFEMTQEEIAAHHGVDARTVRNWLKKAGRAVGLTGDEDDC